MTVKNPLCLYEGKMKELQPGDTLPGGSSGSGTEKLKLLNSVEIANSTPQVHGLEYTKELWQGYSSLYIDISDFYGFTMEFWEDGNANPIKASTGVNTQQGNSGVSQYAQSTLFVPAQAYHMHGSLIINNIDNEPNFSGCLFHHNGQASRVLYWFTFRGLVHTSKLSKFKIGYYNNVIPNARVKVFGVV